MALIKNIDRIFFEKSDFDFKEKITRNTNNATPLDKKKSTNITLNSILKNSIMSADIGVIPLLL